MKKTLKILGIDPGSRVTGYGVIQRDEKRAFTPIDCGCIRPPARLSLAARNKIIFEAVHTLLQKFCPDVLVVERPFILKINPQSGLTLGMVYGVAMLPATLGEIPVYAYPPARVKMATVGQGNASKEQVKEMVRRQLLFNQAAIPNDATDALALALCHGNLREGEWERYKI